MSRFLFNRIAYCYYRYRSYVTKCTSNKFLLQDRNYSFSFLLNVKLSHTIKPSFTFTCAVRLQVKPFHTSHLPDSRQNRPAREVALSHRQPVSSNIISTLCFVLFVGAPAIFEAYCFVNVYGRKWSLTILTAHLPAISKKILYQLSHWPILCEQVITQTALYALQSCASAII